MPNIKICISDNFNNFKYVFLLDEKTTIFTIKENLATILNCTPDYICLANEGLGLDDNTTLQELNAAMQGIINLSASAILVSESTAGAAPISPLEKNLLTPATLLWMEWANKLKPENTLPLRAIVADSIVEARGLDVDSSNGIPIAIPMNDLAHCVQQSISNQRGAPIDFDAFIKAWGLDRYRGARKENVLTFSDFERLMELFSIPESHFIFSEAARAAVQKANELNEAGLITNIAQHVAQALLPLAGQIFADAVNSSLGSGARGAFVGFLPKHECEEALKADGRIGSFLLRLSNTRACELVVTYIAPPIIGTAASTEPTIKHEVLALSSKGDGYIFNDYLYYSFSTALACSKSLLKHPCLIAALAIRVGTIEGAIKAAPKKNTPLWVVLNTLRQEGCGKLDATFNASSMDTIKEAIDSLHQFEPIKYAKEDDNRYSKTIFNERIMERLTPKKFPSELNLQKYYFQAFYGISTFDETLDLLRGKQIGTYLLRASISQKGSAILAFVHINRTIEQRIISAGILSGVICSEENYGSLYYCITNYLLPKSNLLTHELIPYAENKLLTKEIPWNEQVLCEEQYYTAVGADSSTNEDPDPPISQQILKDSLRSMAPARTQALAVTATEPDLQYLSRNRETTIVRHGLFAVAPQVAAPLPPNLLLLPGLESFRSLLETIDSTTLNAPEFRASLLKLSSDFLMQKAAEAAAASANANYNKSLREMMALILATSPPSDTLEADAGAARAPH